MNYTSQKCFEYKCRILWSHISATAGHVCKTWHHVQRTYQLSKCVKKKKKWVYIAHIDFSETFVVIQFHTTRATETNYIRGE